MNSEARDLILGTRDLAVGYGARVILRNVDLTIRDGEFWFLLGPNGSGKSTLLATILGLTPPLSGSIQRHPERAGHQHLGFVPQRCEFNSSLPTTVREFVALGMAGMRLKREQRRERSEWALGRSGLGTLGTSDYWALSGGQRQRALVARALVRRPCLMIVDEPTEGLDPGVEHALLETLAELNRGEGMTVLFVTHKITIAARYATHVALLRAETAFSGPREEIFVPSELERAYGVAIDPTSGSVAP